MACKFWGLQCISVRWIPCHNGGKGKVRGDHHMRQDHAVFLLDVDNTLLDTDQVTMDLAGYLEKTIGHARQRRYWNLFMQLRTELGYADYLGALQRYRVEYPHDRDFMLVSRYLFSYPFVDRLFPDAFAVIRHIQHMGRVVLVSDGDAVFQPRKIERAGLFDAVCGHVLIYVHKEELDDIEARYPAEHYVLIDDKPRISQAVKNAWGSRVTTVFLQQGHYAFDSDGRTSYWADDVSLNRITDLLRYDVQDLSLAAHGILPVVMPTKTPSGASLRRNTPLRDEPLKVNAHKSPL